MSSRFRPKKNLHEPPELNITAFMNLMVVLVPFLLLTAVFSQITILELFIPPPSLANQADENKEDLQLEVILRKDVLEVADRPGSIVGRFEKGASGYDMKGFSEILQKLKRLFPDKTDALLLSEPDVSYDTLVQVMDKLNIAEIVTPGQVVRTELFKDISLGDAPAIVAKKE
ncbi:MAG: hypothetical protein FD165_891 [Gammaproteobacteria bacterium]|nr:MAG: hypothetical protein FD165_891 [Gammaproteobacteria bacterium]TND06400.1 MAG: hypothetical protein FD120_887 [Gammaproteobacteria bacterium]